MESMTQYLRELFINNEKPVTRSQYLVMLSMIWLISSFFLVKVFMGGISTFFIAQQGIESLAEFTVLMNVMSTFTGVSVPWAFAAFVMAFCLVKRAYNIKSVFLTTIASFIVFVFFRLLIMAPVLVSGEFNKLWTSSGDLPSLQTNLELINRIWLCIFALGFVIIIYPLLQLSNNNLASKKTTNGISRESFAKVVLGFNLFFLVSSLILMSMINSSLIGAIDKDVFLFIISVITLLVFMFTIYIIWQRLRNANKSIFYFLGLVLVLIIVSICAYFSGKNGSVLIMSFVPVLISIGITLSSLFACYLFIVPERKELKHEN